jgi:hypothetical protein
MALEAERSRRRSTLVAALCALLGGLYVAALLIPATCSFFDLTLHRAEMPATALLASAVSIAALALSVYFVRVAARPSNEAQS